MADIIVSVPANCWNRERLACFGKDCRACWFSQMRDGRWVGSERCRRSECLKPRQLG